ncbi:MAG: MFS transporter [Sphingomonas adhaesiva]|uniref:spinster family MFS transporter n=1 Tax=Sphingomonas adhaesiva TaxID=28212 RepID=UPI002FF46B50
MSGATAVRPGGWWALTLIVLVYIQSFVDRTILSALGEPIRRDLGLGDAQLGLLGGLAFALTYSLLGVPAAFLSERMPRRTLIAIAILIWSAMTMACGLATGFLSLLVLRAGVGIGEAGFTPPAHALVSDFFPPQRRALALALFSAAIPLGVLVAAIGGGWLAHATDWRHAFLVVGAPGLILGPLLYLTMREPRRGEAEGAAPAPPARPAEVLRRFARARSAVPLIVAGALASVPSYALYTFGVSFFVRVHELGLVAATTAFGIVVAGGQLIGMIVGGRLTDRLGRTRPRAILLVPAVALTLGALFQAAAWWQGGIVACLTLLAFGTMAGAAFLGPSYAALHGLLAPHMRASGMSLVLLVHALIGFGFGPPLIGWVSDRVADDRFGGGFAASCRGALGHGAPPLPPTCADASAAGITAALIVAAAFGLVAAAGFALAARSYPHDLARAA